MVSAKPGGVGEETGSCARCSVMVAGGDGEFAQDRQQVVGRSIVDGDDVGQPPDVLRDGGQLRVEPAEESSVSRCRRRAARPARPARRRGRRGSRSSLSGWTACSSGRMLSSTRSSSTAAWTRSCGITAPVGDRPLASAPGGGTSSTYFSPNSVFGSSRAATLAGIRAGPGSSARSSVAPRRRRAPRAPRRRSPRAA